MPDAELDTYRDLPPTQALVLDVLAAYARLGENCRTFSARCRPALEALEEGGLVRWKGGPTERTCIAWLTGPGRQIAGLPAVPECRHCSAPIRRCTSTCATAPDYPLCRGWRHVGYDDQPVIGHCCEGRSVNPAAEPREDDEQFGNPVGVPRKDGKRG